MLLPNETLQQQGIVGEVEVSCTFVPSDLYAAWRWVRGSASPGDCTALEGVTRLAGAPAGEYLHHLPDLESLALADSFDMQLEGLKLPESLQSLTIASQCMQNLEV